MRSLAFRSPSTALSAFPVCHYCVWLLQRLLRPLEYCDEEAICAILIGICGAASGTQVGKQSQVRKIKLIGNNNQQVRYNATGQLQLQ